MPFTLCSPPLKTECGPMGPQLEELSISHNVYRLYIISHFDIHRHIHSFEICIKINTIETSFVFNKFKIDETNMDIVSQIAS